MATGVCVAQSIQTGMTWPTLSGTAGDWTTLLDALLVNGSNTVVVNSITRVGGVATVTCNAAHGMTATQPETMRRVKLAGTGLEAEYAVANIATFVSTTVFTMPVTGTPTTPSAATGMTVKHPGAGWAIAFTGTNKRAYRAPTGLRHYLRVVDDGTTSAAYARMAGYVTMSDVDTGTEVFPSTGQIAAPGLWFHKSNAASAALRAWFFAGDTLRFYFITDYDGTASFGSATSHGCAFGEAISYRTADAYHTFIIGYHTVTPATTGNNLATIGQNLGSVNGHYIARSYTQIAGSTNWWKVHGLFISNSSSVDGMYDMGGTTAPAAYPDIMNGGLTISRLYMINSWIRGELPGIWAPMHNRPVANYDTWNGIGNTAGRQFMQVNFGGSQANSSTANCAAFEVSDTWDS